MARRRDSSKTASSATIRQQGTRTQSPILPSVPATLPTSNSEVRVALPASTAPSAPLTASAALLNSGSLTGHCSQTKPNPLMPFGTITLLASLLDVVALAALRQSSNSPSTPPRAKPHLQCGSTASWTVPTLHSQLRPHSPPLPSPLLVRWLKLHSHPQLILKGPERHPLLFLFTK